MKICKTCGAYQADNRAVCIDCGGRLGKKLSTEDEIKIRGDLEKTKTKLTKKLDRQVPDPFKVNLYDKIFAAASIVVLAASVTMLIIMLANLYILDTEILLVFVADLLLAVSAFFALKPEVLWQFNQVILGLTVSNANSAEPSEYYYYRRKISIAFTFVVGAGINILAYWMALLQIV